MALGSGDCGRVIGSLGPGGFSPAQQEHGEQGEGSDAWYVHYSMPHIFSFGVSAGFFAVFVARLRRGIGFSEVAGGVVAFASVFSGGGFGALSATGREGSAGALSASERGAIEEARVGEWVPVEDRSEEHTSELQSRPHLVCRLLLEKKKKETHHPNHVRSIFII